MAGLNCSLPVELVSFEARYETGRGTTLRWATAAEQNSAYFAVEAREEAEAGAWHEVLRQPAAGTTPRRYAALDARLLGGLRYYRLRQADRDGRVQFSPLAVVSGKENSLGLHPNPGEGRVQVNGPATPGRLSCYDLAGRLVARFDLPAGLYQLKRTDGTTRHRAAGEAVAARRRCSGYAAPPPRLSGASSAIAFLQTGVRPGFAHSW